MRELSDVEVAGADGVAVVRIRGEIDLSNVAEVTDALEQAVGSNGPGLVVDLSGVDYLDSTGVRLLFRIARLVEAGGGSMRTVVPADAHIRRVLTLADVEQVVPIDDSDDAAVEHLRDSVENA